MPIATDQQVQQYVDGRTRPRAEQIRNLIASCDDDKSAIDDVYAALTQPSPTWADARTDGPPHLLAPADVLAWNTFITRLTQVVHGTLATDADRIAACNDMAGQWPVVQKCCVRALGG